MRIFTGQHLQNGPEKRSQRVPLPFCPAGRDPSNHFANNRTGSVLLIVLVIVVLLTLGVYTFSELAVVEHKATSMYGRGVEARIFADSGIDVALSILSAASEHSGESFFHRPDLFQGILLKESDIPRGRGYFTAIAPVENDTSFRSVRYGLIDESSKLNINALGKFELNDAQMHALLMPLPGMTDELADAILDWVDEDSMQRYFGAENAHYMSLAQPYFATDGPMNSLDELLLVRGVTPRLLYGDDRNRNGLMDPNEDVGDGVAHLGWSAYLTVLSREANLRSDGTKKINLNDKSLTNLYDQIEEEFDSEAAKFVIGFRMSGDKNAKSDNTNGSTLGGATTQSKSEDSADEDSNNSDSQSSNSNNSSQSNSNSQSRGDGSQSRPGENPNSPPTRGGIDLSKGPKITINSIYELVGAEVEVTIDGDDTTLESPWSESFSAMSDYLPQLVGTVSTNGDEIIEGRININQARREVLLGLPDMTEKIADSIVRAAPVGSGGEPISEAIDSRTTTGWLVTEKILTLEEMKKFDRYFTTRGNIYRIQTVGFFAEGGQVSRLEAVIDAAKQPPVILFVRDLTELGTGYSKTSLLSSEGEY